MTVYEDFRYELFADDDASEIVTCRMCSEDCALAFITEGLCPDCASLCASAPVTPEEVDAYTRRAHLVGLTRKAFLLWQEACELHASRVTALYPSRACIEEAAELAHHRLRRYTLLETRLSDETGLPQASVFNSIAQFPNVTRLLRAGL